MSNPFAIEEIDRSTAANEPVNPYSSAAIEADSRTALRGSLLSGQSQNPDQVAEAVKLSRTTGAPYEAIQPNLQEVSQGKRLDDYERMIQGHKTTQRFLTIPQNAAMANDDVGTLTALEREIRDFIDGGKRSAQPALPAVMTGREFSEAVRLAKQNNPALDDTTARQLVMQGTQIENARPLMGEVRGPAPSVGSIASGLLGAAKRMPETFDAGLGYIAADILGLDRSNYQKRLSSVGLREAMQTPQFETSTGKGLYGGAVSTIQNAPGIALSVATGSPIPGLTLAGVQSSVPAYSKYRERGASGAMAGLGAVGEGAVEVATEMLPMGSLLKVFGKEGKGAALQFLKSQFQEQWTEQIATAAQDAIDTAIANPDKTWAQYAAERPDAAYQTFLATLVQSGAVAVAHKAVQKASGAAYVASGGAARAEQAAANAENLTKLAEASKLRQRDPESFAQFVKDVAEDSDTPTELFIDAETLTNTLNQSGITMEQLQMVAPVVAAQLRAASFVPGADIRVPVAEFAAAGSNITTPLIDHLRESPQAMSRAEAKAYLETEGERLQGDVERELGRATDGQAYQQSVQAVATQFEDQLNKAGKFRPEVNKAYANLLGNFYASQAARAGMTPKDFMQKYQLEVAAKDVAGQQTLSQGGLQYPLAPAGTRYEESDRQPVMMTPDEFLARVRPLEIDESSRDNIDALKEHIQSGKSLDPLHIRADGKEDGRHRAIAAKELGIAQVPVIDEQNQALAQSGIAQSADKQTPKMMAVHNLSIDNLLYADKIGGLAVPSVGVITDQAGGVEGFGEITLIGRREMVDPKSERVFSSDAYTMRFPRPEYAKAKSKDAMKLVEKVRAVSKEFDDRSLVDVTFDSMVNTPKPDEVVSKWLRSNATKALYLREQGTEVAPVTAPVRLESGLTVEQFESIRPLLREASNPDGIDTSTGPGAELASEVERLLRENYKALGKRNALAESLISDTLKKIEYRLGGDSRRIAEGPRVSSIPTSEALDAALKGKEAEFKAWVDDQIMPKFGEPFLKVGSKKLPYTLPNIVDAMTDSKVKGKEKTMTYGPGQVRAAASVEFSDLEQMREAAKNSIADPDVYKAAKEQSEKLLSDYREAVAKYTTIKNWRGEPDVWEAMDGSMRALAKWATSKKQDAATMKAALKAEDFNTSAIPAELIQQAITAGRALLDAPVPYFEAKPQRAVSLSEFAGAVVPAYAPKDVLDVLAKHGIATKQITADEDRTQAAKSFAAELSTQGEQTLFQDARATLNFANDITKASSVIALLDGADLSSFLHESGHFFLEVQADLAMRIQSRISAGETVTPAEQGIVDDMNALLKWFGVTDTAEAPALDQWAMKSLEQRRDAHETFARGFERYAMEGRAPTQELQSIFSKFRSWLLAIYKQIKNLNVDLTDEVRSVMDRMLASNEAIQQAEDARNMGPLFQSPDQAGMTPEEFGRYQALGDKATTAATAELDARLMKDMKWLSNAKAKALKALQAEADELRKETEREVRAEVMSEPVYRAWAFLTGKQDQIAPGTVAPEDMTTLESGKLRTSMVKQIDPALWSRLSERRMTSEDNGMSPDIVADIFGFSSGDELVKALAQVAPPSQVIAEQVDQRMLERHGDITSAEAMDRAADEAVHNELRARVIATELKAVQEAGSVREGKRSTVDVLARAAKEYAQGIIDRQLVRNLRPSQYAAAAARSSKMAQQALGKSTEDVALHKRNELINTYATKASYDAQDEVKAAQSYFRKFDKRRKSIDPGYQDQIEQLLEAYDFKPASLKAIDKRKSFAAWYAEQEAIGTAPNVPDSLINDAGRKSYKDMTVEEVRGLRDTIKQIEHMGRLKNKLLLARDKRDFDAIAKEMAESIAANGGPVRAVQLEGPNPVVDWFAGVGASHRKLASLFRQMDGGQDNGPMYQHIGRAMNERGTMEDVANEKATEALTKLYAPMLKLPGGVTGYRSKVFIPEINNSLTRGGRLSVALNWGNEANRQRVMDGDKWTQGQVDAIIKTLSPEELQFVNSIWEYIDSFWPEIAAKEKRLTGVEPEKVEAAPFVATASDGSKVQMRGGYYPLKYDTARSDRADTQEAAQTAKEMMQGAMTRATTRRGHTKERLKEVKRAVRKDLNVITQHITQVNHDLAWHEWLIDTNKLLADDAISGAIRDYYGPKVMKTIRDDILGIATADVVPQTDIDKALLKLRSNVTRATMGASLSTAFLQPFGLTQSMVRIGPKHVLRGMARWGGEAARMENTVAWVREKSEFMRLRAKTFNKELREIQGAVGGKSKTMRVIDAGLFAMMQKMQMVADIPTWVGQYEKSLGEGLDEASAVAQADRAVLESQGGGQTKDLSEVQRKHPMLTQFYSYFNVTLNLAAEKTAETDFKNPAAVAGWLGDMALLMVIPAILPSFIMFALKGGNGDDEDMAERVAKWQLGYLLSTVVLLREFSGATSGFDYAGPPVGRIAVDVGKATKQIAQGEMDEPAVISIINLLGSAFGIPTVQALRSYKGWKSWDEGQEGAGPQSVLFGPPPRD